MPVPGNRGGFCKRKVDRVTFSSGKSKAKYLYHMRENMSGHMELGAERFTGFFLGSWFYVTYHSGYEWNRRYTNQKNAAMGYVKDTEGGCEVHFSRFRGTLCPMQFLSLVLVCEVFFLLQMLFSQVFLPQFLWMPLALAAVCAPISTLFESMTEKSEEGCRTLLSFLMDPEDPYGLYSKLP